MCASLSSPSSDSSSPPPGPGIHDLVEAAAALTQLVRAPSSSSSSSASPSPSSSPSETTAEIPQEKKEERRNQKKNNNSPPGSTSASTGTGTKPEFFPLRLHRMLASSSSSGAVASASAALTWLPHGRSFVILRPDVFVETVLPLHFPESTSTSVSSKNTKAKAKTNNSKAKYPSFTRKLNRWGFRQINRGPDAGAFHHPSFCRDDPDLCLSMECQKKSQIVKGGKRGPRSRKSTSSGRGAAARTGPHASDAAASDAAVPTAPAATPATIANNKAQTHKLPTVSPVPVAEAADHQKTAVPAAANNSSSRSVPLKKRKLSIPALDDDTSRATDAPCTHNKKKKKPLLPKWGGSSRQRPSEENKKRDERSPPCAVATAHDLPPPPVARRKKRRHSLSWDDGAPSSSPSPLATSNETSAATTTIMPAVSAAAVSNHDDDAASTVSNLSSATSATSSSSSSVPSLMSSSSSSSSPPLLTQQKPHWSVPHQSAARARHEAVAALLENGRRAMEEHRLRCLQGEGQGTKMKLQEEGRGAPPQKQQALSPQPQLLQPRTSSYRPPAASAQSQQCLLAPRPPVPAKKPTLLPGEGTIGQGSAQYAAYVLSAASAAGPSPPSLQQRQQQQQQQQQAEEHKSMLYRAFLQAMSA